MKVHALFHSNKPRLSSQSNPRSKVYDSITSVSFVYMITFQTWKDLKTLGFFANVLGTAQGIHHEDNIGESEIESCSRGLPEDRANWVRVQTGNQLISKMAVVTTKMPFFARESEILKGWLQILSSSTRTAICVKYGWCIKTGRGFQWRRQLQFLDYPCRWHLPVFESLPKSHVRT